MTILKKIIIMSLTIVALVAFKDEVFHDGLVLLILSSITYFTVEMIFSFSKRKFMTGLFDSLLAIIQFLILTDYCLSYLS